MNGTCPKCGGLADDVMGDVCGHEIHAPHVVYERARIDVLAAGGSMAEARAAGIRARRELECHVTWCEQPAKHDGPHQHDLLQGQAMDVDTGRPIPLSIRLQGKSARTVAVVITIGERQTAMTWPLARDVEHAVGAARQQHEHIEDQLGE